MRHRVPSWTHTDRILRNRGKARFLSPFCSLGFSGQCNGRTRCFRSPETFLHTAALRLLPRAVSETPPPTARAREAGRRRSRAAGQWGEASCKALCFNPHPRLLVWPDLDLKCQIQTEAMPLLITCPFAFCSFVFIFSVFIKPTPSF